MPVLRILFAWLLIAAVPMQGFAAASMLFCGMGAQHQHAAEASEPHDHATPHSHTSDAAQGHAQAADPAQGASSDTGQKCSICAACCSGVALVGLDQVLAMTPAPQAALAEPFVLIHTLPTPVPDKPPRA
ncbi:MAG: hypothetical protein Q7T07_18710 [Burkholderiaceae bacterium]|nr:hypothetical protein [Burkholderiaceae bacterium]